MTTLVATRQALQLVPSMSDQQKRRTSKRLAGRSSDVAPKRPLAAAEYEQDDDFHFVRKSKRPKTEEPEPARKPGRGRPAAKDRTAAKEPATSTEAPRAAAATTATTAARRSSRRSKESVDAPQAEEEPQPQPSRRATRKSKRLSGGAGAEQAAQANGARRSQGRGRGGASPVAEGDEDEDAPQPQSPVEPAKIALPMSDTPVINRNKEMRKKGGSSNRRSSLGSHGRRASSLIENGQTAIPHRDVDPAEFYKHIEAEGLPEPRRMKQLLMWCGERALSEKPPHGTPDANAILGARAIQDQLLKDFASRSELSDWFSRDDDEPKPEAALKPNPRNVELDEKLASLKANIQRLEEERRAWLAIQEPPPELPPLYSPDETDQITLPDFDLLDPEEGKIRGELADEANSLAALGSRTEARLRRIQSSLEFEVDQLADNVHKLEQRVAVAGKEADRVLEASAARLREREQREKTRAGTRDMAMMEVLRSLGSILPEGNGG